MTDLVSGGVDPDVGRCGNHPDRFGTWYEGNVFLCMECSAKAIIARSSDPSQSWLALCDATRRRIGMLVHFAIDQLWYASPDAVDEPDEDHQGCCPYCCAACNALWELLLVGDLDAWAQFWPDTLNGNSWWDEKEQMVDREWLRRAWGNADALRCHT